jgi:hypothetical protein
VLAVSHVAMRALLVVQLQLTAMSDGRAPRPSRWLQDVGPAGVRGMLGWARGCSRSVSASFVAIPRFVSGACTRFTCSPGSGCWVRRMVPAGRGGHRREDQAGAGGGGLGAQIARSVLLATAPTRRFSAHHLVLWVGLLGSCQGSWFTCRLVSTNRMAHVVLWARAASSTRRCCGSGWCGSYWSW